MRGSAKKRTSGSAGVSDTAPCGVRHGLTMGMDKVDRDISVPRFSSCNIDGLPDAVPSVAPGSQRERQESCRARGRGKSDVASFGVPLSRRGPCDSTGSWDFTEGYGGRCGRTFCPQDIAGLCWYVQDGLWDEVGGREEWARWSSDGKQSWKGRHGRRVPATPKSEIAKLHGARFQVAGVSRPWVALTA